MCIGETSRRPGDRFREQLLDVVRKGKHNILNHNPLPERGFSEIMKQTGRKKYFTDGSLKPAHLHYRKNRQGKDKLNRQR